ncbi:ChrR family anti-sigma-E factor [Maricaulis parjimensis]|uniref:ChrR family anti-sigma-E factor n=1 Tax=Maricaulis parjimensis TaxID=144023 RepID=UPI0019393C5E|nr:ChrR family anti-sigma-E factor [Maricaulis parjimensis]
MTRRGNVLEDSWYLDYAAGNLESKAHDVIMASHVELSDEARERVQTLERVGAALMPQASADTLGFSADDVLALDMGEVETHLPEPANDADPDLPLPAPLTDWMRETGTQVKWSFLGPGLSKAILWRGPNGQRLWLLRAQPGVSIPNHGHNGSELTLVLKGSFWDGETQYRPGDLEEAHAGVEHDIRIDDAEECVCLALTEGKLRFDNPLLKLFQVFTGL